MIKQYVTNINMQIVKEETHMTRYEEPTMDIIELRFNEVFTIGVDNGSSEVPVNPEPGEEGWG